jgi:hypothetical protein
VGTSLSTARALDDHRTNVNEPGRDAPWAGRDTAAEPLAPPDSLASTTGVGIRGHLSLALQFVALLAASGALQIWQPVPGDADTAYHVAVARLIREHGLLDAFPWIYIAWHLPLVLVALAEAARLAGTGRADWRGPVATATGLALGIVVHPNASSLMGFWRIVHLDILVDAAWRSRSALIGTEFQPFDAASMAAHAALPLLAAAAALWLAWLRRQEDSLPLTVALAGRTLAPGRLAPLAAVVALGWSSLLGLAPLRSMRLRMLDVPPATEAAWRAAVPEAAQVFTCGWLTTGELMLALPERRFLVALDPVLFWKGDAMRAAQWQRLRADPPPLPALLIRNGFGARFVLCERVLESYRPLLDALDHDPGARIVVLDPLWVLYELLDG